MLIIFTNTYNGLLLPSLLQVRLWTVRCRADGAAGRTLPQRFFTEEVHTGSHAWSCQVKYKDLKKKKLYWLYLLRIFRLAPKKLVLISASMIFNSTSSVLSLLYAYIWKWNEHVRRGFWGFRLTEVMTLYWLESFIQGKESMWTSNQKPVEEGLMRSTLLSMSRWVIFYFFD